MNPGLRPRILFLYLAVIAAAGCQHDRISDRRGRHVDVYETSTVTISDKEFEELTNPRSSKDPEKPEEPYALRVNRTLLYPVQHGRAEDMVETIRPVLEGQYGPGVVVVAHTETNHLMIYLPPYAERNSPARTATPPSAPVRPGTPRNTVPSPTTRR